MILDTFKEGDKSKLERFLKQVVKDCKNEIKKKEEAISDLREEINDLNERIKESLLAVNLGRIGTNGEVKEYSPEYIKENLNVMKEGAGLEKKIKQKEMEISYYQSLADMIETGDFSSILAAAKDARVEDTTEKSEESEN